MKTQESLFWLNLKLPVAEEDSSSTRHENYVFLITLSLFGLWCHP